MIRILVLVFLVTLAAFPRMLLAESRPNILLVYVDDLGYGDLGSFGHPVIQTPNLDRLARSGMTLTSYYAPSALCSPSRAALLTGRTPYRSDIESWIPEGSGIYLDEEEVTIAELLRDVGYQTAIIGKWHLNSGLGRVEEPQPLDHGFDYHYGHNAFQIPSNKNPTNIYRNGKLLDKQVGYTADLYANEAIKWLRSRDPAKQFFLFLSMAEPHGPIENPPEMNEIYSSFSRGVVRAIPSGDPVVPKGSLVPRGPGEYYANITYLDSQLGRVFRELDLLDLADNTLIVFASDNGPVTSNWLNWYEVNSYGNTGGLRGRKHLLYEGGIRVPAILSYPGVIEGGSASDQLVIGMDLFATLADFGGAQLPIDRPIDGINIRPIFQGSIMPQRTVFWALSSLSEMEFAVRAGSWKMMLDRNKRPRELYDLTEDPLEFFNLLDDERSKADELLQIFYGFIESIGQDPIRPSR